MIKLAINVKGNARGQRGAALILALLVVALVAAIATSMASDYFVMVKRATNQLVSEQAWSYLRAAEMIAMKGLRVDLGLNTVDGCDDVWAEESPPFMLEDGAYGGRLQDLQGKFNINSLVLDMHKPENLLKPLPVTVDQARFIQLLLSLNDDDYSITDFEANNIAQVVVDWLDNNQTPMLAGAEDSTYESLDDRRPYHTADGPMLDSSEMLLLAGMPMPPILYQRLLPHITVWPLGGEAGININTATLNVLRSLNVTKSASGTFTGQLVEESDAQALQTLLATPFSDIADLKNQPGYDANVDTTRLVVKSDYFRLHAEATLGDLTVRSFSVISRKGGVFKVINRSASASSVINSCVAAASENGT